MNVALLAGSVLLMSGCAGLAQTGSVAKAYDSYEHGDYEETLSLITQAETLGTVTPELKAELTYLRAMVYGELDQKENAHTLFEYLKEQHEDSQYGYLAARRLEQR